MASKVEPVEAVMVSTVEPVEAVMREQLVASLQEGDRIAVYRNRALDSVNAGARAFLYVGAQRTIKTAPPTLASTHISTAWAYVLEGFMEPETGVVVPA